LKNGANKADFTETTEKKVVNAESYLTYIEKKKKMRPPVPPFFLPACPWVSLDSNKAPFVFLGDALLFLVSPFVPEFSLSSMYLEPQ
jgi:hypothetical protein